MKIFNIEINEAAQIITAVLTLLTLLTGLIKWMTTLYLKISKTVSMVENIQKEFYTNGGSSLRDAINKISENQHRFMSLKLLSLKNILYNYINENYLEPIMIVDRYGQCEWANDNFLKLTNRKLEDIIGTLWENTIYIKDRDWVKEEWYQACESGRSFNMLFRLNNNNDNTEQYIKCNVYGDTESGYIAFFHVADERLKEKELE